MAPRIEVNIVALRLEIVFSVGLVLLILVQLISRQFVSTYCVCSDLKNLLF
jgi:hypothetical protein